MIKTKLRFRFDVNEDGKLEGVFTFKSPLIQEFDDFLFGIDEDHAFASEESRESLMKFCSNLALIDPGFLDAYVHAAGGLLENKEVGAAKIWYERGLKVAYSVMPKDFSGIISWLFLENRPFLRLHHGLILSLLSEGDVDGAITEAERHLQWNPNDNIGVRFILADLYTHANQIRKARALMKEDSGSTTYPAFHYNEALLYFRQEKYYEALTRLRKGFIANPYIAEILLGNYDPMKKPMWIGHSYSNIDAAKEYVDGYAGFGSWMADGDAIGFLNWAYNCSMVLKDRALQMELHEKLDRAEDFNERGNVLQVLDDFKKTITLESSKKADIVIKNRRGANTRPWNLDAYL